MRLADFILAHLEPILADWEVFARGIWPDAAGATDPAALRDDAENMLRAAVTDMRSDQTSAEQSDKSKGQGDSSAHQSGVDRVSSRHGSGRHDSGFDLPAVIAEYRALRGSVIRLWVESHPPPELSDLTDLTRFNESIDQSLAQAVLAFSKLVARERQAALDDQSRQAQRMREVNESLLVSSVRQHELAEQAQQAEASVRVSEERYRTLFDLGPVAVYSRDASGAIETFNRRAAELWGRAPAPGDTEERFYGSFKLFRPDGSFMPHEQCPMAEVLGGTIADARDAEMFIERSDGSRIAVVVNIRSLKDRRGEVSGAINCFYDITDRKRAEQQLQDQAAALTEADRRKNEFLAMLAHELRNPLAPIRNAAQVLRLSEGNKEAVRSASAMMERQVGQMVRLVDDLLDVSRVSRGKIELRRGRIELASSVHHAVEASRSMHESMGHDLTVTLPPKPIYLNADPTRLTQVLGNLLNNACKFTDKGGRISLAVEQEGEQAVIRVRDTGIGIAADQLTRIFDVFTQVDTSLERSVSGLGIGLTLVKSLVEMHDGTVEGTSAGIGHGSEFVVRLPVLAVTPEPPPEPPPELAAGVPPTTGRRILVVDDNRDSAESLAALLKLTGNETHTAYDGVDAVEAAAAFRPGVVLLDIGLPRMNGYEVARKIREQPWGEEMVLVALTGWGQDEDRRKSKEVGFDGHLVKPVDFAVLTRLLAELLPTNDRPAGVARIANG